MGCFNSKQCSTYPLLFSSCSKVARPEHTHGCFTQQAQGTEEATSTNGHRQGFHKSVIWAIGGFERGRVEGGEG